MGAAALQLVTKDLWVPDEVRRWNPKSELGKYVRSILKYLPADAAMELIDRISSCAVIESSLALVHRTRRGKVDDLGVVGRKVVTTVGVGFIVDAFQNIVELETMKYHGLGTGNTAEAVGDTALVTELTTQYNPNSTRATGSTTEGAGANVYRTVGTNTVDASAAVVEHGIFSDPTVASGVLLDRTVFSVVNLGSGDSLQSTYDLTVSAGG